MFIIYTVLDPLKGTKSTCLRPRASGGLAPGSSAEAPWGPHWLSKVLRGGKRKNGEGRRKLRKNKRKTKKGKNGRGKGGGRMEGKKEGGKNGSSEIIT